MENNDNKTEWVVSYRQIGLLILVFALGVIFALLLSNAQTGTPTAFTTTELIGFVLAVILSGASIVLAISAIALGKSSEYAVIKRSDESIRLQNDVFIKTTEALQRIEASTGVTEKRIEDIISGRVGDISQKIAEMATSGGKTLQIDARELEENIWNSIIETIGGNETPKELIERQKRREEKDVQEVKYQESHEKLLYIFANKKDTSVEKIGHGTVPNKGDDLFDGIFRRNGCRVAVSTFRPNARESMFASYINSAAESLSKNEVDKILIILFDHKADDEIVEKINLQLGLLKEDISSKTDVSAVSYENLIEWADKWEL